MAAPLRPGPWWRPAADSPLRALEGRMFTHVRAKDVRRLEAVRPFTEGIVLTGPGGAKRARTGQGFAGTGSGLMLLDPAAHETQTASFRNPFTHGDGMWRVPLGDLLDAQREAGATVALTPTLKISAGDVGSLVSVLRATERQERQDVLCLLPLEPGWLRPRFEPLLRQALHDFPIPIALMARMTARKAREIIESFPGITLMRTGLEAFDAMARGSPFASILPKEGVWLDELLTQAPGRALALMFADKAAPACHCGTCQGRRLDRFVTEETRSEADAHMHEGLSTLHRQLSYVDDKKRWWRNRCKDAIAGYSRWFSRSRSTVSLSASTALRFWAVSSE